MKISDRELIASYLPRHFRLLAEEGEMEAIARLRDALRGQEIEAIETYRRGSGDGVWFRLVGGRVFDRYGWEVDGDPELYLQDGTS
ncbi:MAG TPA: hypothetical protein ENJ38_11395 [Rhodospirillales bacterium]|nr:hypothetical protein [Rhodospirillales bacterium]